MTTTADLPTMASMALDLVDTLQGCDAWDHSLFCRAHELAGEILKHRAAMTDPQVPEELRGMVSRAAKELIDRLEADIAQLNDYRERFRDLRASISAR